MKNLRTVFLLILTAISMTATTYAYEEEVSFEFVLLDAEGIPLCGLVDGVRNNNGILDEEVPEGHFGDVNADMENLPICTHWDVFDILYNDEDIVLGMIPLLPTSIIPSLTSIMETWGVVAFINVIQGCITRNPNLSEKLGFLIGGAIGLYQTLKLRANAKPLNLSFTESSVPVVINSFFGTMAAGSSATICNTLFD